MNLRFHKYESIGNDFVLIEEQDVAELFDGNIPDHPYANLAKTLCDRKFGIGSDGLLTFARHDEHIVMRMFNPDGTEDFCGNGLRCAALHAKRLELADKATTIQHGGKEIEIAFSLGGWIDVGLPEPNFDPASVPLAPGVGEVFEREMKVGDKTVKACSVNVGSTHTVLLVDGPPEEQEFQELGPAIENHEWFPERTSVIWCWQREGRFNAFQVRIWERGVGETLGCGTGSAAAAACIFRTTSLVAIEVKNPGGECAVALGPDGTLCTSAKARHVFSGTTKGGLLSGILPVAQDL